MGDESRKWTKFGRYALLDKIGSGGMAEIYRAKTFGAAGFEKEYAIKLIIPSLVDDTEFVDMFINEAKIVVNLYHANIVQVFDLGEIDDQYYIAMEYVHGKDLLDILARCAERSIKIPMNLVLFITMEMLKGLNFAHQAKDPYGEDLNIIHRDISPSNILISYAGDVKVGDFGVAKAAIERSLSDSDTLKGKVGYMSPEQVMGEEIDHRSDIFSAGIVFFEALSMSRLFVGNSDLDVMLRVRDADIDAALQRVGPLPGDLERIVRKAMAKHPEDRFQTAGEFYQELVDFCYQHDIKVTGNDLSNLMRRLFAAEIEEEKTRRRKDPKTVPPEELATEDPGNLSSLGNEVTQQSDDSESEVIAEAQSTGQSADEPSTVPNASQVDVSDIEARRGGMNDLDVSTAEVDDKLYRFRDAHGDIQGPMSHDEILELLHHRIPNEDDRISVDNGPWKPPPEIDTLEGSVPDYSDLFEDSAGSVPVGARVFRRQGNADDTEKIDRGSHAMNHGDTDVHRPDHVDGPAPGSPQEPQPEEDEAVATSRLADDSTDLEATVRAMEEINVAASQPKPTAGDDEEHGFEKPEDSPGAADDELPSESLDDDSTQAEESDALDELREQYASYEGSLEETPCARLLARLHLADATGRLHVQNDSIEKSIYFRDGEPILVDSNKEDELLGSFLLSKGLIDEEQLNQALARLHEWGGRLGDALVAIGAVPAHDIYELLTEQMREKLLNIFTWPSGYYGYFENQEPDTKGYPLGIDALQTVVEGCRNRVPFDHLVEFYAERESVTIHRRDNPTVDVDQLRLSTRELRVFNSITESVTLNGLLREFPSTQKSRVYRMVYLLHQLEVVTFEDSMPRPLPDLGGSEG